MAKKSTSVVSSNIQKKDFRGLTVFELLTIAAIIGAMFIWAFSTRVNIQNQLLDAQREARVTALKEQMKAYVAINGSFPSTEQFEDESIRKKILAEYLSEEGSESLSDPADKNISMYYLSEPEGCAPDTENLCTKVSLSLKLSNGEDFIKFAIKPGSELLYLQEASQSDSESIDQSLEALPSDPEPGD